MMFPSIFESLRPGVGSDGPWKAQRDVQIHKSKRMISENATWHGIMDVFKPFLFKCLR